MAKKKTLVSRAVSDLTSPQTREERYLANIAGLVDTKPSAPFSRLERYLDAIATATGGSAEAIAAIQAVLETLPSTYAPAGYGLGTYSVTIPSNADLTGEPYISTGFFAALSNVTGIANIPAEAEGRNFYLETQKFRFRSAAPNDPTCKQIMTILGVGQIPIICMRLCYSASGNIVWTDWEYANPPLVAGTEYRTTERYKGSPVFTKLVEYQCVGSSGDRLTPVELDTSCIIIGVSGVVYQGTSSLGFWEYHSSAGNVIYSVVFDKRHVYVDLGASFPANPTASNFVVKYIRTA